MTRDKEVSANHLLVLRFQEDLHPPSDWRCSNVANVSVLWKQLAVSNSITLTSIDTEVIVSFHNSHCNNSEVMCIQLVSRMMIRVVSNLELIIYLNSN